MTTLHPVDIHVGQRLRTRRRLAGFSQSELAAASAITFQQVQKYERGSNRISASRLVEFSRTLKVHPAYFFDGLAEIDQGEPPPSAADWARKTLAEDFDMIRLIDAIAEKPEAERKPMILALLCFVETIAGLAALGRKLRRAA